MFNCTDLVERVLEHSRDDVKGVKGLLVTDEFVFFNLFKEVQYQSLGKCLSIHNFNIFTLKYYIDNRENILRTNGYDLENVDEFIDEFDVGLSDETIDTLQRAEDFMVLAGKDKIDGVCLVLALIESENPVLMNFIVDYEVDIDSVRRDCTELLCTGSIASQSSKDDKETKKSKPKRPDKIIEETCTDLTQLALDGELDPIIGRERELEAIINTMARRSKNNVLLVGEPGIGKYVY